MVFVSGGDTAQAAPTIIRKAHAKPTARINMIPPFTMYKNWTGLAFQKRCLQKFSILITRTGQDGNRRCGGVKTGKPVSMLKWIEL
jgi:hypothetical protein